MSQITIVKVVRVVDDVTAYGRIDVKVQVTSTV